MNLRNLFSHSTTLLRRSPSSRNDRTRRATNRLRPSMLETLEERLVMSLPPGITILGAGANTSPALIDPVDPFVIPTLIATTPTFNADHSEICTTVTNGSSLPVVLGVATYADQAFIPGSGVPLTTEVLTGFLPTSSIPAGGHVTICVAALPCQQFDLFVMSQGNTTYSNVQTTLTNPGTAPHTGGYTTGTTSTLLAFAQTSGPNGALGCPPMEPLSQGFWKNHTEDWNLPGIDTGGGTLVYGLDLGDKFYSQTQLSTLLSAPAGGNATLILDKQLIAAKLNILNGAVPTSDVFTAIFDADAALTTPFPFQFTTATGTTFNPAAVVHTNTTLGARMTNDASILDAWQGT